MINPNPAIEQKINQFILETQNKFSQDKSATLASYQTEAKTITQETNNLRDELIQKLGGLTFSDPLPSREELEKQIIAHTDQLVETINLLSTGKISETPLDTLSQETDSLVTTITTLFDANANVPNLPKLKEKLTAWQTKVKDTLVKFSTTVELQQKNESLIAELKDKLDKYSSIPKVDEPFEKLVKEFKDNFAQLQVQEESVLFQTLSDLINEIKARDEVIKLNQRIDILLEKTKEQVAGCHPEFDHKVQGELATLITILGSAQVELMDSSKTCAIMQVKSVVDSGEIAIKSLIGNPNIILAQRLRYAAKTELRKIQQSNCPSTTNNKLKNSIATLLNFRDDFYHSFKIPTKVLIGLLLAVPLNLWIIKHPSVNELLDSLPPITTNKQETAFKPSQQQTASGNTSLPSTSKEAEARNFIILIWMTGTLGGAVSILTRLQDFDNPKNQKYDDDLLPFIIGLTKPILGGSFAFFILLILNSNIFPLQIRVNTQDKGNGIYLYGILAMAFVAGFSERIVPDLITQVEKKVTVEDSSTGRGLPQAISIAPPSATLALNREKEFTINPVGNYTITISPPESGKIDKNTTDAKFTYTAPPQGNAGDTITITATSDSGQTAKATVTLTA